MSQREDFRPRPLLPALGIVPLLLAGCFGGGGGGGSSDADEPTVRGEIDIDPGTAVDWTVNDPNADRQSNNSLDDAQPLATPAILGGYAQAAGTNVPGNGEDPADFYQLSLAEQQEVRLQISDFDQDNPETVDLDLYLFDDSGELVDYSVASDEPTEQVTAPRDGEFTLEVRADEDAPGTSNHSNYILLVGEPVALLASGPESDRHDSAGEFVVGEVIVHFDEQQARSLGIDASTMAAQRASGLGLQIRGGGGKSGVLMRADELAGSDYGSSSTGNPAPRTANAPARSGLPEHARQQLETIGLLKRLRRYDDVRDAELNHVLRASASPNDEFFEQQWNLPLIGLDNAWTRTQGSEEVVVAVIDTGVFADHEDLSGKLVESEKDFAPDCDINADDTFHGTQVAGIAAASTDNVDGIAGVGWNTRLMSVRALCPDGTGTTMSVRESVRYAAGLTDDADQAADIINLSLGGSASSGIDAELYEEVVDTGIIVTAAAGNDGDDSMVYPASYDTVFAVGASDREGDRAPYSNTGLTLDFMAPGGFMSSGGSRDDGVLTTDTTDGTESQYAFAQGTSMATPHAAGMFALMRAEFEGMTYDHLVQWLSDGELTESTGGGDGAWNQQTGYGLLDADSAVAKAVAAAGERNALLRASPRAIPLEAADDGVDPVEGAFELNSVGEVSATVRSIGADVDWLDVETISPLQNDQPGEYRVVADPDGKGAGTHYGHVTITTDAGATAQVRVALRILTIEPNGQEDAGLQYVQLRDAATRGLVAERTVNAEDGRYAYRFDDIEPGDYFVIAGTDNDNDAFICDAGEACGASESITVSGGETRVPDFTTGYRAGLEGSSTFDGLGVLTRQGDDSYRRLQ